VKVFVTGATGYIGSSVSAALLKHGHQVIGLARSSESAEKLENCGIEPFRGDIRDKNSLSAAAREADAMVHAASPNDSTSAEADNAVIDTVCETLQGTDKPFIYTSGIWVIGETGNKVADEDSSLYPIDLVKWRAVCEQRVLAAAKGDSCIRASVLRPGIVYGRGGGIPASFVQSAKERGVVAFVGDGENHWPVVHVDDLADLYVRVLNHDSGGLVFHGISEQAVKVRDIAFAASEGARIPGKISPWPVAEARKILGPFADALALDQQISSEKTKALLGWEPKAARLTDELRQGSYKAASAK
jgi:nucleoside-diphosphate-sugar epimerase